MNVFAMLKELEDPTEEDILEYLSGNLCRCIGICGTDQKYSEISRL